MKRFILRWILALVAVFCGWVTGFLAYLAVANGSSHDQRIWAIWTALFCLSAWLIVGLPLAIWNPDLSSPGRAAIAVLACGLFGVLMTAVFFSTMRMGWISLLAFITASTSMLVYRVLWRRDNVR